MLHPWHSEHPSEHVDPSSSVFCGLFSVAVFAICCNFASRAASPLVTIGGGLVAAAVAFNPSNLATCASLTCGALIAGGSGGGGGGSERFSFADAEEFTRESFACSVFASTGFSGRYYVVLEVAFKEPFSTSIITEKHLPLESTSLGTGCRAGLFAEACWGLTGEWGELFAFEELPLLADPIVDFRRSSISWTRTPVLGRGAGAGVSVLSAAT